MDPIDAHPDFASPPPAYSEQEFDAKLSQATELSLQQAKWETSKLQVDADGWPRYDPAMFEEEPASLKGQDHIATTSSPPAPAASSSSSSVTKRPLPDPSLMKSSDNARSFSQIDIAPLNITKKSESRVHHTQDLAGSTSNPVWSTNPFQSVPNTEPDNQDEGTGSNNAERQDAEVPSYPEHFQREPVEAPSVYPAQANQVVPVPSYPEHPQREPVEAPSVYPAQANQVVPAPSYPEHPQREPVEAPSVYPAQASQVVPDQTSNNRPLSRGDPEPQRSDPWTPTLEPLDLPTPADHSNNFYRPDADPNVRPVNHFLHHRSFQPLPSPRTITPERPRIHSTIVPTVSQPCVPRVNFNPNVAYGASATTAPSSFSRLTPQKPHIPVPYNPHMLYKCVLNLNNNLRDVFTFFS